MRRIQCSFGCTDDSGVVPPEHEDWTFGFSSEAEYLRHLETVHNHHPSRWWAERNGSVQTQFVEKSPVRAVP